jgi:hypothetical protein
MTSSSGQDSAPVSAAVGYLSRGVGHQVIPVAIERRSVLVAFEPDLDVHRRREDDGTGAIRSRRLLHALWSLPYQLRWPAGALDPCDTATLRLEGAGFVDIDGDGFVRRYQPPGRVWAVGVRGSRLLEAVERVGLFPTIFRRYAIASRSSRNDQEAVTVATNMGIGTVVEAASDLTVLSEPDPPQVGVPGVYRWWLSEVAYEGWRQLNVH